MQKEEMQKSESAAVAGVSFEQLNLVPVLLQALADEGYTSPTPIQAKAVPHILAGRDLFGCAQTGTGKTAAFALPIIQRLMESGGRPQPRRCRVLVLAPTRELAGQINDSFKAYGRHARIKTAVIYGGVGQRPQANAMIHGVDVLIATPGRLLDLIGQRLVDIRSTEVLVLDEADRMLDMGFIHDMRKIVAMIPKDRQTLLFSATLPAEIRDLASQWLRDPLEVKTAPQSTPAETVAQSVYFIEKRSKKRLLAHLLKSDAEMNRVIVFARTKHGSDKLMRDLEKSGIRAAAIHGNKSQNQRELALKAFKSQNPPVLIATDIAARGIDVDNVSHVVNFDLPHEPETYVHRIGRTGRAGMTGKAVSFCDREERGSLKDIERLLRKQIPALELPAELPAEQAEAAQEGREGSERSHRDPQHGRRGDRQRRPHTVIGGEDRVEPGRRPKFYGARKSGGHTGGPRAQGPRPQGQRPQSDRTPVAVGASGGAPQSAPESGPQKFAKKKHRRAL
jgi:ATP-dependent RNA helicase RhlE